MTRYSLNRSHLETTIRSFVLLIVRSHPRNNPILTLFTILMNTLICLCIHHYWVHYAGTYFVYEDKSRDPSLYLLGLIDFLLTHVNSFIRTSCQLTIVPSLIAMITIFWHRFALHIAITIKLENDRCNYFVFYSILNSVHVLLFWIGFIPPILMALFDDVLFRNMKRLCICLHKSSNTNNSK
jgi:hypothetical protein